MLLFGVCINDIEREGINWKNVIDMLQEFDFDLYESFLEDMDESYSDQDAEDWFLNYESKGGSGIGAFLHDLIESKEKITLDIDYPDAVYIGISPAVPWEMDVSIKNLTKKEFSDIMHKYIRQITDTEIEIRWWKVDDDLAW